ARSRPSCRRPYSASSRAASENRASMPRSRASRIARSIRMAPWRSFCTDESRAGRDDRHHAARLPGDDPLPYRLRHRRSAGARWRDPAWPRERREHRSRDRPCVPVRIRPHLRPAPACRDAAASCDRDHLRRGNALDRHHGDRRQPRGPRGARGDGCRTRRRLVLGEPRAVARPSFCCGLPGQPMAYRARSRPRRHARRALVIELTIFRTGGVEIGASAFVPGATDEKAFVPVWSALLRTPEGNVLFDTGLHPVHVERPDATFGPGNALKVVMTKEDAVVARLASLGVRPDEVTVVVNSHLHFDHAGNNGAFPKATFIVQGDHLAFAKGKPNFPGIYWDIPELTYMPVAGRARVASVSRW